MKSSKDRRERKKKKLKRRILFLIVFLLVIGVIWVFIRIQASNSKTISSYTDSQGYQYQSKPKIEVRLLTPNDYSRSQEKLGSVHNIVIHYVANPMTSALSNRSYFEGLKDSHETFASAHFIIGLQGEIVQCIPTSEIAFASNGRNSDTLSIECCHEDEDGKFNSQTYQSLVELCAFLLGKFDLTPDDLIRHYDVTGKMCPKYYVEHSTEWEQLKQDVSKFIREKGSKIE